MQSNLLLALKDCHSEPTVKSRIWNRVPIGCQSFSFFNKWIKISVATGNMSFTVAQDSQLPIQITFVFIFKALRTTQIKAGSKAQESESEVEGVVIYQKAVRERKDMRDI